jgi:hypothetical protein
MKANVPDNYETFVDRMILTVTSGSAGGVIISRTKQLIRKLTYSDVSIYKSEFDIDYDYRNITTDLCGGSY